MNRHKPNTKKQYYSEFSERTKKKEYLNEFQQTNSALLFGFIVLSFGVYILTWIYARNKEFQMLDKYAPDPVRGSLVIMLIPVGWFFIIFILKKVIFPDSLIIGIIEIVVWGIIIMLILKYLIDFCLSFGRITGTNGLYWFLLILPPLCILTIPAMQAELNSHFNRITIKRESNHFYS